MTIVKKEWVANLDEPIKGATHSFLTIDELAKKNTPPFLFKTFSLGFWVSKECMEEWLKDGKAPTPAQRPGCFHLIEVDGELWPVIP